MFKFPDPMDEFRKKMEESNRRLMDSVSQHFQDQVNKLVQPIQFKLPTIEFPSLADTIIRESTRGIEDAINRFNPILAKASEVMARHGWWLIRQLPLTFYSKVASLDEDVTQKELVNFILGWFSRNEWEPLTEIVNAWNLNGFNDRQRHFQDALEIHKQGRYTMTIPGLIFHVEGIVREFIQATDNFTERSFVPIRERFREKFGQLTALPEDRALDFDDVEAIENYYNLQVLERLYQNYRPENHSAPETINRHAIGHGLWTNYDSREASLYLLLLLDMVHAMLEQFQSDARLQEGIEPED